MEKGSADWRQVLGSRIPLYGHRNWIVVADAAYPAQTREGIETLIAPAGQVEVLEAVLAGLGAARHVRPVIYTDQELAFVAERDAPGISAYRERLQTLLRQSPARVLPHEEIIAMLDEAGGAFRVLILKTTMMIPYTSVFFELGCGYWTDAAEQRLRSAMEANR